MKGYCYFERLGIYPRRKDTMETEILPQLHTLEIISQRTSMSRSALYREIQAGRLTAVKIGKALRISESELQRWINSLSN